jgi:hypothetical protein
MSKDKRPPSSNEQRPLPSRHVGADERGLQPAKNPPPMPQVKPPKSEKSG